jgi:hypothetical protein
MAEKTYLEFGKWGTCGACHPEHENVVCNRGCGHRGEHQDVGPEGYATAATIWYRWPRAVRFVKKGRVKR